MRTTNGDFSRTLIIGNSGSGKSWLAARLARRVGASCVDLDPIHWLPGGYNVARERHDAVRLIRQAARADRRVIEGIYGSLVNEVLAEATMFVRLCPDEAECTANIRRRGIRRGKTAALLDWAATYRTRRGSSSYAGHEAIFAGFNGDRKILRSREAVTAFAARLAD